MDCFERYMIKGHIGKENAVKSKDIEDTFYCTGSEVRRMVNELRCKGVPICSSRQGYYYATSDKEIQETIARLEGRIQKIKSAQDGLKASFKGR